MKYLRKIFYLVIFLVTFTYVAIVFAPVSLIQNKITSALPPNVNLIGLEGRLGAGKIRAVNINGISLNNLSWTFNPFLMRLNILLPAKHEWRLRASLGFAGFKVALQAGSLNAINIPMVSLQGFFTGKINFKSSFKLECQQASGQLKADKLEVESPVQTSLNAIGLNLACKGNKTLLTLTSGDANLTAKIDALLDAKTAQIDAQGKLGEHDLTPLLETMVHTDAEGNFTLQRQVRLN